MYFRKKSLRLSAKAAWERFGSAHDSRLNREVAIKVSDAQFTERFAREAKIAAGLNHPNICTLHDVGPNYLVMELVEGPTLGDRLKEGALPLAEATRIARQIADALDYAHEKGVIHRDLKPGNIKIRPDGLVKVLDFGLAKMGGTPVAQSDQSPTVTMNETAAGMILGTAAYMSPEQAKGKEVDKRSDIYAFGVVFYEMLSGVHPHKGDTLQETLASVLKDDPDLSKVPAQAHRLLKRCLEKDPQQRQRHIGDVMALMDDAPSQASSQTSAQTSATASAMQAPAIQAQTMTSAKRNWLWPSVAAVLLIAAVTTGALYLRKPSAPSRATRFEVTLPEDVQFDEAISLSPDGHKMVFNAIGKKGGLWIRDLDTLEWRQLPDTQGALGAFWSPDSRFLAFGVGHELKKIEVSGGPPQTLCTSPNVVGSGTWNRDGIIVFDSFGAGPLYRVSAAGGAANDLTVVDASAGEFGHALPTFLPDGKHFLYLRQALTNVAGVYAGSLDAKPAEQSKERIFPTKLNAPYVDGYLFYLRDGTLTAQAFDDAKLQLHGDTIPVAEHVGSVRSSGSFSVSPSGVLAYRIGAAATANLQTSWLDRQGRVTGTFGQPGPYRGLALSPDETRAAGRDAAVNGNGDIWLLDFARGAPTRLTFRQSAGRYPVWSPDGTRIVFAAGDRADTIYEKVASGAGGETELLKQPWGNIPTNWSHDGRFLLYTSYSPKTFNDLWVLPLEGDRKPVLLLGTAFVEGQGSFSPDMRWIVYTSNESGQYEVYVRPFVSSRPSLGDGKWQISKDGGTLPKWRGDGKEIFFRNPNGSPMAVDVNGSGAAFEVGVPKQLFVAPANLDWDVTADGKRLKVEGTGPARCPDLLY